MLNNQSNFWIKDKTGLFKAMILELKAVKENPV